MTPSILALILLALGALAYRRSEGFSLLGKAATGQLSLSGAAAASSPAPDTTGGGVPASPQPGVMIPVPQGPDSSAPGTTKSEPSGGRPAGGSPEPGPGGPGPGGGFISTPPPVY